MAAVKGSHQILMPFYVRPDLHHIFFVARHTQTYKTLQKQTPIFQNINLKKFRKISRSRNLFQVGNLKSGESGYICFPRCRFFGLQWSTGSVVKHPSSAGQKKQVRTATDDPNTFQNSSIEFLKYFHTPHSIDPCHQRRLSKEERESA